MIPEHFENIGNDNGVICLFHSGFCEAQVHQPEHIVFPCLRVKRRQVGWIRGNREVVGFRERAVAEPAHTHFVAPFAALFLHEFLDLHGNAFLLIGQKLPDVVQIGKGQVVVGRLAQRIGFPGLPLHLDIGDPDAALHHVLNSP